MATIMDTALWTLTEAAAERMVANGLIKRCEGDHTQQGTIVADLPIYHRACDAPDWFGFATMHQAITAAQAHVEEETDGQSMVPHTSDASERLLRDSQPNIEQQEPDADSNTAGG